MSNPGPKARLNPDLKDTEMSGTSSRPSGGATGATPKTELEFDGNPIDLRRLLAHVSVSFLADSGKFPTDSERSGYLAKHFRGPALDWLATRLGANPNLLSDFRAFETAVKNAFGLQDSDAKVAARMEILAMKQRGDLLVFISEFEALTEYAGMASDATRVTLFLEKLEPYYQNAVRQNTDTISTWTRLKSDLHSLYAMRRPQGKADSDATRKRSRCGKCGKKGHSATQCRSVN